MTVVEPGPIGRGGWQRLTRALIAYGLVGITVALVWLAMLVWVNGRIADLRAETEGAVPGLVTSLERTSKALHDASTTAQSFRTTLDESAGALSSAAGTITQLRSDLSTFEGQLRAVNILGARPLSSTADAVGRIVGSMQGLDTRLSGIADGLRGGQVALAGNAISLRELAESADGLVERFGQVVDQRALSDVQLGLSLVLLLCAVGSFLPAIGALVAGLWLRRQLARWRVP